MGSAVVAFSGGVDSTFLLNTAIDVLKNNVLAVIASSQTYPSKELEEAKATARSLGAKFIVIQTDELKNPEFCNNPKERCYYCKSELFSRLKEIAFENKIKYVVDGSNVDDNNDFRPGRKAAKEFGVRSPLMESGFTKKDIRRMSKKIGLSTWDKPSLACLASRIPYGTKIEFSTLNQINDGENFIRDLGFNQVRVRHHGSIARIELEKNDISRIFDGDILDLISDKFKKLGYNYVTVDIEGFRSGSMNEVLNI